VAAVFLHAFSYLGQDQGHPGHVIEGLHEQKRYSAVAGAGHDGGVMSEPDIERLARTVYIGARSGAADREAAFDLACRVLEENGTSGGVFPLSGSDPVSALVAVADDAQDAVMHTIWGAWPVCPAHGLGVSAREAGGAAVWSCKGAGGHVAAPIGRWGES
jgi:hypothetical protein